MVACVSISVVSPLAEAEAVTAEGGGCGKSKLFKKVGLRYKSCIWQGLSKDIHIYEYMTYTSDSKSVYKAWVKIQGWLCSGTDSKSQCKVERRSNRKIDITYYVNKRPRPAYDKEKGYSFDANPGQILRARSKLCVKMTSSSSTTCSKWAWSPWQIAGS